MDAAVTLSGYEVIKTNDVNAFQEALVNGGPLAIAVAAETWMYYQGGVFDKCGSDAIKGTDIDHGVQCVGWAKDDSGQKYWIVRNSWGPRWGESGYIYLKYSDGTDCGVDNTPADGIACKGDTTKPTVCGECGILFDAVRPKDVHIIAGFSSKKHWVY